jgi:hypothetical protein
LAPSFITAWKEGTAYKEIHHEEAVYVCSGGPMNLRDAVRYGYRDVCSGYVPDQEVALYLYIGWRSSRRKA